MALRIDKINLKATDVAALPVYGLITTGTNLNTLDGSVYGKYWQSENANSPTSLNYPVAAAGTLLVLKNNASNLATSCTQIYLPYNRNEIYSRSFYNSWTAWSRFASIDMDGANSTIKSLTGLTTALSIEQGGTGVVSKEAFRQSYNVPTKDESLLTENNLSDLADRAAAWLNVRPIGSTPLAGDPVNDYDAVTKRWVENKINTGTVGPTMNGVMNYGVGDFHLRDSRAYIQPYEVVSDGQLLNRADWPELWAYAQMVGAIDDSKWLADKFQRGKYSSGNGTTTFRVPDKNGVQEGSIRALYGRGDGGNSGANGQLFESAAPNITAAVPSYSSTSYAQVFGSTASGAFFVDNAIFPNGDGDAIPSTGNIALSGRYNTLNFDASRSSPIYGTSNDEILTRNFVGVWVIRASGGFVAANTSWSVKNADSSAPPQNTSVRGGEVVSEYSNPAGKRFARLYSDTIWGSSGAAIIEAEGSAKHSYKFYEDGTADFRQSGKINTFRMNTPMGTWNGITDAGIDNLTTNGMDRVAIASGSDTLVRGYSIGGYRPNGYPTKIGLHMYIPGNNAFGTACMVVGGDNGKFCRYFFDIDGQIYGSTDYGNFSYTKNGTSDSRVKHGIAPVGVDKSYSNIKGLEFVEFIYDNDEQNRVRHGVIAQQAEVVEPLYVKTRKYVGNNPGEVVEQKELDTTPMLLDTMHVVQVLMQRIEAMEAEIAELKASK
ncbi:tail fiber protein [Escherichia phage IME178]|uniref:Tail fiber protein n=1 Tax=Escherichia phage IME178 TaxID=2860371 RepID=A0AC61NAS5_9CAUD|nr:tail fiber protein [Escherichia phage IME178]